MAATNTNDDALKAGQSQDNNNPSSVQQTIKEEIDDEDGLDDTSKQRQIELEEERKLKAKHPCIQRPGSDFLQKRLQRGQKYFDSGDYNMAKASTNSNVKLPDGTSPVPPIDSKILSKRH